MYELARCDNLGSEGYVLLTLQTLPNKPIQWTVYYISKALSLGTFGIYQEYDTVCMRV